VACGTAIALLDFVFEPLPVAPPPPPPPPPIVGFFGFPPPALVAWEFPASTKSTSGDFRNQTCQVF